MEAQANTRIPLKKPQTSSRLFFKKKGGRLDGSKSLVCNGRIRGDNFGSTSLILEKEVKSACELVECTLTQDDQMW